jgi:Zn-dependent protease with chaperone function
MSMKQPNVRTRTIAIVLAVWLAMPVWAATPLITPELPNPGKVGMTREQQEQLGLKGAAEVYKQMPVLPDSDPVTQYVQQLGKKLLTVIPPQYSWPYQFHVIPQSDINAFALPGGPIFVNIGTINAADNEAQLAGVMAHEMAHVYMQHSAKQAPKQEWAGILGALGGLLGGTAIGDLAAMGIQMGAGTLLMKYSRGDEAQADAVGAIIMYKAGYDPKAMALFFQKLQEVAGNGGPQFLSDHPNPGNRVEAVSKEIANWKPQQYLTTSPEFVQAKAQAGKIQAYNAQQIADGAKKGVWAAQNRKNGAVLPGAAPVDQGTAQPKSNATLKDVSYDQVKPGGNLTSFQGQDFSIGYPANWQNFPGQTSVVLGPQAGVGDSAIAYGVILSRMGKVNANDLDNATQGLVQNLQKQNPDMKIFNSMRSVTVAGRAGRSVDLSSNSPVQKNGNPVEERDWLVTVPAANSTLLYFVFIAPSTDFDQLQPTYQAMLDSLTVK